MRFLTYLLYNSFKVERSIAAENVLKFSARSGSAQDTISAVRYRWSSKTFREFVAELNTSIREEGVTILLPDVFRVSSASVENENAHQAGETADNAHMVHRQSNAVSAVVVLPKLWQGFRREDANQKPWRSHRLNRSIKHECRKIPARACIVCSSHVKGVRTATSHRTQSSCNGCNLVPLCRNPRGDGRTKSCWDRWHYNGTIEVLLNVEYREFMYIQLFGCFAHVLKLKFSGLQNFLRS